MTQTTSSAAGNMTITVKYRRERREFKLLSVTYSGNSAKTIKHPSLTFVFAPSGPPFLVLRMPPRQRRLRILVFTVALKGPLTQFSGSLPARVIAAANRHGGLPGREALTVNLGNVIKRQHGRVTARLVMQEGLILTPGFFVARVVTIHGAVSAG